MVGASFALQLSPPMAYQGMNSVPHYIALNMR